MESAPSRGLVVAVAVVVAAGIALRFAELERKYFWLDETHTWLWISGHSRADIAAESAKGPLAPGDLERYMRTDPGTGVADVLRYLAREVPHHPPLYGVLAWLWAQAFGSSVLAMRALPALLSVLALPAMYALARELFGSRRAALLAVALLAVSPFHIVYAQEARPYSLFTLAAIASSAAFLRARRLETGRAWAVYAVAAALALYAYLFSAFVLIAHAVHVAVVERFRPTRRAGAFLGAAVVAGLLFAPWAAVFVANRPTAEARMLHLGDTLGRSPSPWPLVVKPAYALFDIGLAPRQAKAAAAALPAVLLLAGSLLSLWRRGEREAALFATGLIVIPALCFVLLVLGRGRPAILPRYIAPCYAGALLPVAWLLGRKTEAGSPGDGGAPSACRRRAWQAVALLVLAGGLALGVAIVRAETWWNKLLDDRPLVPVIDACERPLVVGDIDGAGYTAIGLSRHVDPKVRFHLVDRKVGPIPEGYTDVIVLYPTRALMDELAAEGWTLVPTEAGPRLSRLVR